jgi:hypothetical protein
MKASLQSSPCNVPDAAGSLSAPGSERQCGGLNVPDAIAVVNAVSSSIKFSLFEEHDAELALKARGQIEGIYSASYLIQPRSLALLIEREIQ